MHSTLTINCLASSSSGNAYTLNFNNGVKNTCILLDAGISTKVILNNIGFSHIDYLLISHKHKDHYLQPTINYFRHRGTIILEPVKNGKKTALNNNGGIIQFEVKHGVELCNAFYINFMDQKILYATDFSICEYNLKHINFNVLMLECNYVDELISPDDNKTLRQINTHMSLNNLVYHLQNVFNVSEVKEIYLMHLSDSYSNEEIMRATIKKVVPNAKVYICKKNGGVK